MERTKSVELKLLVKPDNKVTDYLCNFSSHGFFLEERWWPSVEHYLHAKKFEGTQYEEQFRLAPTIFQARRLLRERGYFLEPDGATTKKYSTPCEIRKDWEEVEEQYLEGALRAKFSNHYLFRRLAETSGYTIITPFSPKTGSILEKIRDEKVEKREPKTLVKQDLRDISSSTVTDEESKILFRVVVISEKISLIEGCNEVHSEMMEDALSNFMPLHEVTKMIDWVDSLDWTDVYVKMPKFEKMVKTFHTLLSERKITSKNIRSAALLAGFVRWYRLFALPEQQKITRKTHIKIHDICFMKVERPYRKKLCIVKKVLDTDEDIVSRTLLYDDFFTPLNFESQERSEMIERLEKMERKERGKSKKILEECNGLSKEEIKIKICKKS